jgi:hypothetical protein
MTEPQFEMLVEFICGIRRGLLVLVDVCEAFLIANNRLKCKTSDLRKA